jgi:UDPglucose--hexose-1-phosphate uridylyltransferase
MWSTKFLPTTAQKMLKNQEAYYKKHKSPMLIDYLEKELKLKERIILEMDHFVILTPFWAYWPYEVMILPRRNFQAISDMSEVRKRLYK